MDLTADFSWGCFLEFVPVVFENFPVLHMLEPRGFNFFTDFFFFAQNLAMFLLLLVWASGFVACCCLTPVPGLSTFWAWTMAANKNQLRRIFFGPISKSEFFPRSASALSHPFSAGWFPLLKWTTEKSWYPYSSLSNLEDLVPGKKPNPPKKPISA